MDETALREGLSTAVPFNAHLGLEYREIKPGRCVVALPDERHLQNHLGSQHGSGLFAAAEAASGGAFTATFAEELGELRPLIVGAEIQYMKLSRGEILAEARIAEPLSDIRQRLDDDGVVSFDVEVSMRDTEREVAQMTARWRLKRR